jgi:predicted GIY-YIG superfamily endonuclease
MYVYMLECTDGATYIGATVDLDRRLRQHNGEIKGGAKRTTSKLSATKSWTRVCYVSQFPDWSATLQFEWRWKQLSRKYLSTMTPLERRFRALHALLSLPQSTSKAVPFEHWSEKPKVHIDTHLETSSLYLEPGDLYEVV